MITLPREINLDDLILYEDSYDDPQALYYQGELIAQASEGLTLYEVLGIRHAYFDRDKYNMREFPDSERVLREHKVKQLEAQRNVTQTQINNLQRQLDTLNADIQKALSE
jgi:hypothetical protein